MSDDELYDTSEKVESCLKLAPLALLEIFKKVTELVWESEPLFGIDYPKNYNLDPIIERVRGLRTLREIKVGEQINAMGGKVQQAEITHYKAEEIRYSQKEWVKPSDKLEY